MFTFLYLSSSIIGVLFVTNDVSAKKEIIFDARIGENQKIINVEENSSYVIIVSNISSSVAALLFEVHSHIHNITLSETEKTCLHCSITGKNIGMVYRLHSWESGAHMWLLNKNQKPISLLIMIYDLQSSDLVPGACNMEFPTEIAPYLKLRSSSGKNYLEYQHANTGSFRDEEPPICSLSLPFITYDVYVSYLNENNFGEEEYFNKIRHMSNASSIKQSSNKVLSYSIHPDTRFSFLMYPNVGVVYNVIAKYTVDGIVKEALYIPISSYGCGNSEFTENGCNFSVAVLGKLFLFILSMYGFITAFFGHTFYGSSMFFFGFLAAFFIVLILLGRFSNFSLLSILELCGIFGILGGVIWYILWLWLHISVISELLVGFELGFLLAATILYSPVGNYEINLNDHNYWLLLATGSLLVTVILLAYPTLLSILGSSVIGSYIMLLFYDDFIGTRLAYIILNIVKRAVSENLEFATNDTPFQIKDAVVYIAWVVLCIFALIIQSKDSASTPLNIRFCRSNTNLAYNAESDPHQPLCSNNESVFYNTFPK